MNSNNNGHEERGSDTHLSQLASVGQIAAGIAHEVRNPLTAVKGFLQLLQQEEKKEYIDIAQSELENALTTLNNLLQVSKPDLEDEENQAIFLAVELESILNLFQDKMYNIHIITEFIDTDTKVFGKKNQFKKAFFNLIKNAFESIEGEGTIKITHASVDHEVIVTIQDSGKGIPQDKLKLLGTPFFTTKEQGTGMGLAQVFSTIYQHGGKIIVDSQVQQGTTFTIKLPNQQKLTNIGVRKLNLLYADDYSIKDYLFENRAGFEERLLDEAINVKDKIEEIHKVGRINLLSNAHKLVLFVVEGREHELISFAKQEGVAWAKYSLTLAFKMDWIQAIRRTLWDFLYNYDLLSNSESNRESFFSMEKNINELLDQFLTHFFISYSKYKDELLEGQRRLVEDLSVPIIPITTEISILPLIGSIDHVRITTIQDKVFNEIGTRQIQKLIIDLSGVAHMDQEVTTYFKKFIEGIYMMGCESVLTGLRSEIVKKLINSEVVINHAAQFKGTLQIALNDIVFNKE
ncbi:ATP-binding protein [Bacillus sp. S/N-304-OC-R1]|uniref:ATP-binding protein n=1 Tax=Bacillus sp. S/N-304-OC-R1 TaxID=2758034 RepID=UPI001C8D66D1|nr:ATP-binding protein [Bacillus sp. S/N-304-OC-R1]MBY0120981.1 STAS domain-containing protein [Bacillus sp. S/N-304-OC-R1]